MQKSYLKLAVAAAIFTSAATVNAETLYGVSAPVSGVTSLFTFDSSAPAGGTSVPITGPAAGATFLGIDVRPATGVIYGVTSGSQIFTITPGGVSAQAGTGSFGALTGTSFGVDFNPIPDRIRFVSNSGTNLRLNPNDGTIAGTDTNTAAGSSIVATAYDRSFPRGGPPATDATPTTLFGIDSVAGTLVRIGDVNGTPASPNGGTVTTIGSLGLGTNLNPNISFDISGTGVAFATNIGTFAITSLYTINLTTGAATVVPGIAPSLVGLTAATVPEPTAVALAGLGLAALVRRRRA